MTALCSGKICTIFSEKGALNLWKVCTIALEYSAVIDKANIIIPQLADISSLTNDLLDCDTLPPDQRDIVNLIQKGVLELWQSLSK
jgi:hypothetical protein